MVRAVALVGFCAVLALISVVLYAREIGPLLAAFDSWHHGHLEGTQFAPGQYRVLSFWIPEGIVLATDVAPWQAYLVMRFVALVVVGLLFYEFCRTWLTTTEAILAVLAFFYLYNLTVFPHFQPAEELNLIFFLLGFMAIQARSLLGLAIVVGLGTLAKQTVVLLVPVYLAYEMLINRSVTTRMITTAGAVLFVFIAVRQAVRAVIGERPQFGELLQVEENVSALASLDPRAYYFLLPSLLPMLLIAASWKTQPTLMRAVAAVIPIFVMAHFGVGRIIEFRLFMPLAFVTIPGTILFARQLVAGTSVRGQPSGVPD